jgi:hypothetical protein
MKNNNILWLGVTLIIGMSTIVNIKNQFETLELAKLKNEELKVRLEQMEILKNDLNKKIEYATTSAFIEAKRKELLGLGTDNDYWLDIPTIENVEIIRHIYETKQESNIQKWLKLFTD